MKKMIIILLFLMVGVGSVVVCYGRNSSIDNEKNTTDKTEVVVKTTEDTDDSYDSYSGEDYWANPNNWNPSHLEGLIYLDANVSKEELVPYCAGYEEYFDLKLGLMTKDGVRVTDPIFESIEEVMDSYGYPMYICETYYRSTNSTFLCAKDGSWSHDFGNEYINMYGGILYNSTSKARYSYKVGKELKLNKVVSDDEYDDIRYAHYHDSYKYAHSNIIENKYFSFYEPVMVNGDITIIYDENSNEIFRGTNVERVEDGHTHKVYFTEYTEKGKLKLYSSDGVYMSDLPGYSVLYMFDETIYIAGSLDDSSNVIVVELQ